MCTWQLTFTRAGHKDPGELCFWEVRSPGEQGGGGQGVWSAQAITAPAPSTPGDAPSTGESAGPRGPHSGLQNGPSEALRQHVTLVGHREEFTECR